MKRLFLVISTISLFISLSPFPVEAVSAAAVSGIAPAAGQTFGGDVLCLPGAYLQEPADCAPLGPSATLTGLAKAGIPYPALPFPVRKTDLSLASIPYQYALAVKGPVPTYSTLDDAMAKNVRREMPAGKTKYLSYSQRIQNDKGVFYRVQTGEWISGDSIQTRVSPSTVFRGVEVTTQPRTQFGWILDVVESRVAPGFDAKLTGKKYGRFNMVWAYAVQTVAGVDWVEVGPNEWLEDRVVDRVMLAPKAPDGVTNGRWIEVNLGEQTLSVYDGGRLVYATLVSSGNKPFYTRPGLFHIYKKLDAEQMSGTFEIDHSDYYYLENVPWTMYFDEARALHGVYWHTLFGYTASHGCVNLAIADARWLYDWAKMGDAVYVWDPTGKTPLDVAGPGAP
jgi:lipoprotein-anchoring transpeptidase ErfK/SrfK